MNFNKSSQNQSNICYKIISYEMPITVFNDLSRFERPISNIENQLNTEYEAINNSFKINWIESNIKIIPNFSLSMVLTDLSPTLKREVEDFVINNLISSDKEHEYIWKSARIFFNENGEFHFIQADFAKRNKDGGYNDKRYQFSKYLKSTYFNSEHTKKVFFGDTKFKSKTYVNDGYEEIKQKLEAEYRSLHKTNYIDQSTITKIDFNGLAEIDSSYIEQNVSLYGQIKFEDVHEDKIFIIVNNDEHLLIEFKDDQLKDLIIKKSIELSHENGVKIKSINNVKLYGKVVSNEVSSCLKISGYKSVYKDDTKKEYDIKIMVDFVEISNEPIYPLSFLEGETLNKFNKELHQLLTTNQSPKEGPTFLNSLKENYNNKSQNNDNDDDDVSKGAQEIIAGGTHQNTSSNTEAKNLSNDIPNYFESISKIRYDKDGNWENMQLEHDGRVIKLNRKKIGRGSLGRMKINIRVRSWLSRYSSFLDYFHSRKDFQQNDSSDFNELVNKFRLSKIHAIHSFSPISIENVNLDLTQDNIHNILNSKKN